MGVAVGVRPLPHRAGRDRRGHPRGLDADVRVRRRRRAASVSGRCARAWATATPPTSRRSRPRSTSSRAAASRWASAAAGTSTSGARTATASRPIPQRLAMLREGVEIMHQAWTTGTATLDGEHYQVDGAVVRPLPLQEGGIPFWIAGGGEKVTLKIAAQYAALHELRRQHRGVRPQERRSSADTATRSAATSARSRARRTSTRSSARPRPRRPTASPRSRRDCSRSSARSAPTRSSTTTCRPTASARSSRSPSVSRARAEHGLGYAIHYFPEAAYDLSGIELFEREVIGALR